MEKDKSTYVCHICSKAFSLKGNLNRHLLTHDKDGIEVECSKCSKKFKNVGRRDNHFSKCEGKIECESCKKTFEFRSLLQLHKCKVKKQPRQQKTIEKKEPVDDSVPIQPKRYSCEKCGKRFLTEDLRNIHQRSCRTKVICLQCNRTFLTTRGLGKHVCSKKKTVKKMSRNYKCKRCPRTFDSRSDLYYHFLHNHTQTGRGQHLPPWGENDLDAPWVENGVVVDQELQKLYKKYSHLILRKSYAMNNAQGNYNWPIDNSFTLDQLMGHAEQIYEDQQQVFKLNICFGFILKNKKTGEYRYYIPFTNETVLDSPIYISNRSDLRRLRKQLARLDITQYLQNRRQDSLWVPHMITNVSYFCTFTDFVLGAATELPDFLKIKTSLLGLTKSYNGYHEYTDGLCLFRSLAAFKQPHVYKDHDAFEELVSFYYDQYRENAGEGSDIPEDQDEYQGFDIQMLPDFEKVFQLNVEIFQLNEQGIASPVYKSTRRYSNTMYLNLWENHLSLIKKIHAFAQKFQCRSCKRHFHHSHELKRHEPNCKSGTRIKYPGGYYEPPKSIFQELSEFGIQVAQADRYNDHFCVFDFESFLEALEGEGTDKLDWLQKHNLISVSVCSNIPDFTEPKTIIEKDQDQLLALMIDYMMEIQGRYQALSAEKWGFALNELEELIQKWTPEDDNENGPANKPPRKRARIESEDEDELAVENEEEFTHKIQMAMMNKLKSLYNRFQQYMSQLVVVGYNSSRYDLGLAKSGLAKHLSLDEDSGGYTIKCGNAYKCIASSDLKFIDICSFLPPGTSYQKFLKCYSVQENKGYFPYDWFKDSDLLDRTELPEFDEFYSPLKGRNLLEEPEETAEYEKKLQKWIVKFSEAMLKQKDVSKVLEERPKPPDTAQQRYQKLKDLWVSKGWTKFSDYLKHYNELDVKPMCTAITRMLDSYKKEGIDLLRSAISIPGIARQLLFKTAAECGASFSLFDKANSDLHRIFNDNLVGGPSIIFNRYHKVGETFIRGNKNKPCRALFGDDANG